MLGYDPNTRSFTVSTLSTIWTVTTDNMLIVDTQTGLPYRTDANPHRRLYVRTSAGSTGWLPVTSINIGDLLFTPDNFASGYLDPIFKL